MDGRVEHRQGESGDRIAPAVERVQSPSAVPGEAQEVFPTPARPSMAGRSPAKSATGTLRIPGSPRMDMRQVSPSSRFRRVAQAWMIRSTIIATSAIPKPATRPLPVSTRVSAS